MKRKRKERTAEEFLAREKVLSSWSEDDFLVWKSSFYSWRILSSRVLKSLFDLVLDSSFDVEFNCNWISLDEKLFRGSWICVGSDWIGFGLLKIRISVCCQFSRSAAIFCCQSDLPGALTSFFKWLGKSLTRSLLCESVLCVSASDLTSDLRVSWANHCPYHCYLLPPGFCLSLIRAVIGADFWANHWADHLFVNFLHFFSNFPISSFSVKTR